MTATERPPTSVVRRSGFDGHVLTPGKPGYDSARSVWNGMIDHRPALIFRCASIDDVVTAIRTARERDLEIGVRCGGHNVAGLAVPHGGLMIDLTGVDRVAVDPVTLRARGRAGRCSERWTALLSGLGSPPQPGTCRTPGSAG
jgi:FAD/FMN-containing dehydrogenase